MLELQFPIGRGVTADWRKDIIWIKTQEDFKRCISQYFGENKLDWYKKNFGLDGHNGLDIVLLHGEDILAAHDGEVIEISDDESAGLGVVIWNREFKIKTIYWHNKKNLVSLGQQVKAGHVIAQGDSTGWSTGDHLHFGMKYTDENGVTINKETNGFKGAVDPMPFFVNSIGEKNQMKLVIKDGEQYLRDKDGVDHHIVNVYSLREFIASGIIENETAEEVEIVNPSGTEWAVLLQDK